MTRLSFIGRAFVVFAILALAAGAPGATLRGVEAGEGTPPPPAAEQLYLFRVAVRSAADVTRLTSGGWDVLEARGPDYLLILGETAIADELRALGFTVTIDQALEMDFNPFAYYGGYRTVVEHYQHLDAIAAAHPDLAVVVDYGDSWRKINGHPNGHDLKAICLTTLRAGDCALDPDTDKPRFFLMSAIHARELSTAELAWRWMDYLVNNYDGDPDITALLDHNEMWIVPVTNPDGRHIVEQGNPTPYYQRKNANNSMGSCSIPPTISNQHGVDLNRNASFQWGGAGTSTNPCSQTYKGIGEASEPEEYYLEAFMQSLFHDQRGPALTDTAPLTTTGAMVTLHSYSDLVLRPWGWTQCTIGLPCPPGLQAPNNTGLRSFAFRMSYYNGYDTGQASELLYAASGTTDDWAYGVLGIPGFTFEIGPVSGGCGGFLPPYSCQDGAFWPLNRGAFLYAAKAARQPYVSTLGPTTISPTLNLSSTLPGVPLTLTALIHDGTYGSAGIGRPASQVISQAEYYVDVPPWAGGAPIGMAAQDGVFDGIGEAVVAPVDTALSAGRHMVFVRGRDADGNWGPASAQWFWVTSQNAPTISDIGDQATDEDTPTAPITFEIGDADPGAMLTVTASSSNPTLAPEANIVFGGRSFTRTVTVTPVANQWGSAVITVTVSDGALSASETFTLSVSAVNDPPTVSDIADQTANGGAPTPPITFTVADVDDPPGGLTLAANSSNPVLVPEAGIVFGGSGLTRTVTITPSNQSGSVTITITVSDGMAATASDTFQLTVAGISDKVYLPFVKR